MARLFVTFSTVSPCPTPDRARASCRRASRVIPSPHRLIGTILVLAHFASEACHTGRPELTVSHLLTVKMIDHGSVMRRYGVVSPEARAKGCVIAYRCSWVTGPR